jgi:hypothetical protein
MQTEKHNTAHKQKQEKNYIVISIGTEKASDKIQHLFMTKNLKKLGIEGSYLNI